MHIDNARLLARIANALSAGGESGVLLWLSQRDGETYASDIVEHFGLTAGRVANIVKQLERRQFITRQTDAADLRRARILLTEEGAAYAARLYREMIESHACLIEALGEEDASQWIRLFGRLISLAGSGETIFQP